jgi:hypothetical protein
MIANQPRYNSKILVETSQDLSAYVGCAVAYTNNIHPDVEIWDVDEHSAPPAGIIISEDDGSVTVGMLNGGLCGTVLVKLLEDVTGGDRIYFVNNSDIPAQGTGFAGAGNETYSGEWYICGMTLEPGKAGEYVEACVATPSVFTI